MTKRCPRCKTEKSLTEFWKNKSMHDGLQNYCKICHKRDITDRALKSGDHLRWNRKGYLKRQYGITHEEYDLIYEQQKGLCAICLRPQSSWKKYLDVDHDHETGKIRGLLCQTCNRGVGMFHNNPEYLIRAASYLGY